MVLSHLISIVGAGPGDPELLTVKAQKRLKEADIILYDALVGEELLELASPAAEKRYVGKLNDDGQNQMDRQNKIHREFLFWAGKNKRVVRLKGGDPLIFGRGAEEIRFCRDNKLNYEVIPGITAGIAGASLFSIPLTERGKNNMVLFYTGQYENDSFPGLDSVVKIINSGSSVLIYMGLNNLSKLAMNFTELGIDPATPLQILSCISQKNQKSYSTEIGLVDQFLKIHKPEIPAVIIVGKNAIQI